MGKKQIAGISIVVLLTAVYFGAKMYAASIAEAKVNEAIAKAGKFADIDYDNVSVDLLGMNVRVSNVLVSPAEQKEKLKIGEIVIYDIDDKSEVPTRMSIACNGIELNVSDLGDKAEGLIKLGYDDNILMNFSSEYYYDKEKKELDIKKISLGADDAGELIVSLSLGNIDINEKNISALLFMFPEFLFKNANIKYVDDSLTDRVIKISAEEKRADVSEFKNMIIKDIEKEIASEQDEFTKKALGEIENFLKKPNALSISVSPEKPQPIGRLMRVDDPKEIIKLLNVKIKG